MNADKTLADLRLWYNGYKFHQDAPSVYNPVSRLAIPTTKFHSPSATGWCAPWPACPTPNSAFEFKLNGSADDAMAQIKDKQYAAGYRNDPRRVILVGMAFDWEDRNLGEWRIEPAAAFEGN